MTLVLLLAAMLAQAPQASNTELGYRFTLPDGFVPFPRRRVATA